MRVPSVKKLEEVLEVTHEAARRLRAVLVEGGKRGNLHDVERALEEAGDWLDSYGVKALGDSLWYVEVADPSLPTVMFDRVELRYRIGAVGDVVRKFPHRFRHE